MARPSKKDVYTRITEKQEEIQITQNTLKELNDELQELINEKEKLQMEQLYNQMKNNGLDFTKAMELLNK